MKRIITIILISITVLLYSHDTTIVENNYKIDVSECRLPNNTIKIINSLDSLADFNKYCKKWINFNPETEMIIAISFPRIKGNESEILKIIENNDSTIIEYKANNESYFRKTHQSHSSRIFFVKRYDLQNVRFRLIINNITKEYKYKGNSVIEIEPCFVKQGGVQKR